MKAFRASTLSAACVIACVVTPGIAQIKKFDVPVQPVASAIAEFGRQADIQIVAARKLTQGKMSRRVYGSMTIQEALSQALGGTGLQARQIGTSSFTVIIAPQNDVAASPPQVVGENAPAPSAAGNEYAGGEILVTARHRDERLVDVPQSITALGSTQLEQVNARRFDDYIGRIPNLTASYGATLFGLSETRATVIRGVQGANTTSYYIDDTPVPATVSPQVLDLDRIEVLRGPQGTLFGASSMGGSIRFITKQPDTGRESYRVRTYGGFTAGGGSADYGAEAAGNFVIDEGRTALRALVQYDHQSGFINKSYIDGNGRATIRDNQGQPTTLSGSLSLLHRFNDHLTLNLVAIAQFQDIEGLPLAYAPLPDFKVRSLTVNHLNDFREFQKDHWGIVAATLKYGGSGWGVTSSTSFFRRDSTYQEDGTEVTTAGVLAIFGADLKNSPAIWSDFYRNQLTTHETRVNLDKGAIAPWLSGVLGVYYQHSRFDAVSAGADKKPLTVAGLSQATGFWPNDTLWDTRYGNTTNNYAVFGELYVDPVERLQLTFGLRKYWIDSSIDAVSSEGLFAFSPSAARTFRQTGYVPKAAVSYKIADRANLYASYSQGFRIGGSQPGLPPSCNADLAAIGRDPIAIQKYGSDKLKSYEVGFKSAPRGRGLSFEVAAFQLDWSGIQQVVPLGCGFQFTANAGKARIRGTEFSFSGRPVPAFPLTVSLGLGYLDPTLSDPGSLPQPAGSRINLVPEWTGNASLYYENEISSGVTGFAGIDGNYTSSLRTANVIPTSPQQRPPVTMLNGRIGARFDRSELSLSVKNILNRKYNLGDVRSPAFELYDVNGVRVPRVAVARPLQVEVQYAWRF